MSYKITQCSKTVAREQVHRASTTSFSLTTSARVAPEQQAFSLRSEISAGALTQWIARFGHAKMPLEIGLT